MKSVLRSIKSLFRRAPWPRLTFPTTGFETISDDYIVEEEKFERFSEEAFYPVHIGEVFAARYQVVGKLGFGVTSTVWLTRDLPKRAYTTLKIYTRDRQNYKEFEMYKVLSETNPKHPGYRHIRTAQNKFTIPRAGGDHLCLVQKPMGDSLKDMLRRNPSRRFTTDLLRMSLIQLFLALDYVHSECKLVHTDIKLDNIFFETDDESIFEDFVRWEMLNPIVRKTGEHPVYGSRGFRCSKAIGGLVLGDFGAATRGDEIQSHTIQPSQLRCPEVLFGMNWSYPADIWNVGVMIWMCYEDSLLFRGKHPDGSGYKTAAHIAEVIAVLGPPPLEMLAQFPDSKSFFDDKGHWIADVPIPEDRSLESSEENLTGKEQEDFLEFVRCMLRWRPEDRLTARQLLDHPWLKAQDWRAKC
ncbi:uncharacterized protein EKO05_0002934 [Ascochyta rabiei]|uniref:ATP binding n=1 Tax=Didymella rabiei TaxID=5454 RepID=A0A162X114_DIDRA|nr:uncharacterized protein EKO05_0002934 [Ascochyta rabiei]KZM19304.1 ATP binding [Ascochyta rabiei]UPX12385.1 hypothetical protein EKO05_0002934 [Ascochyta rabiei]